MYQVLRSSAHRFPVKTQSLISNLFNNCLSLESLYSLKLIYAQLIKLSLCNTNTFLGNRCLHLYSKLGTIQDALRAFDDINNKNVFSWNMYMRVLIGSGNIDGARQVFDEMPEWDVVSWNSIIAGYSSSGFVDCALDVFLKMRASGVIPSGYTYSIVLSFTQSVRHGKQIHCNMIRNGVDFSCVVIGNSLIDMYGKNGLVEYAFGVFLTMVDLDIISWNSLIAGFRKSGHQEMAYNQFCIMRTTTRLLDAFALSLVLSACSSIQDLRKGKTVFSLSIKFGYLSNTIVSSAAIDMFSKCGSVDDSVTVFKENGKWDSAICNSIIASCARHGFEETAVQIFAIALNKNVSPTEFTLSCMINCASVFQPVAQGTQLHSLVIKLGFERDSIVSTSLVEMYCKCGCIDAATIVFSEMGIQDLVSWNSMIFGLTFNGKTAESVELFDELLENGPTPDEITLSGVLLACNHGGFIEKGLSIFSSMENNYGVKPTDSHFTSVFEMMVQAGKLNEALTIMEAMPYGPNGSMCASILGAYGPEGDLKLIKRVAERLMKLEPKSSLPYLVLGKAYERRGQWESVVRVKKVMEDRKIRVLIGCSWIGIKRDLFVFKENEVVHHGGDDVYSTLRLLVQEIEDEGSIYQTYD